MQHLLEVENLSIDFHTRYGTIKAVQGVSWHIDRGETLAIVGESGSGKSVTAGAVLGLVDTPPGIIRSGRILYDGEDLLYMSDEKRREINGRMAEFLRRGAKSLALKKSFISIIPHPRVKHHINDIDQGI